MTEQEQPVTCAGCGRQALRGDAITPGADTWWGVAPPFEVGLAAEELVDEYGKANACSPDCAARAIDRLRPHYERLEEELVNHPEHIYEGGKG